LGNDLHEGSRSNYRSKRKKTNLVLNSLIVLVLLLIIIVSAIIFLDDEKKTASENNEKTAQTTSENSKKNKKEEKTSAGKGNTEEKKETEEEVNEDESEGESIVTEGGSDSNVQKTIENPSWKPVGTSQTGEHVAVYDQSSADWQEMINAFAYATGIDTGNMTVWYIGSNNGNPNKSIGTVSSKDVKQSFRVYIEWIDGQGWKPTLVEELIDNDKD
jgi:cytoskeletal protein RodZ